MGHAVTLYAALLLAIGACGVAAGVAAWFHDEPNEPEPHTEGPGFTESNQSVIAFEIIEETTVTEPVAIGDRGPELVVPLRTVPTTSPVMRAVDPYEQGRVAADAGASLADDPYPEDSRDSDDWRRGWARLRRTSG